LRWNATSLGHPGARYGHEVEGILVVSNAAAGSAEEEAVDAALEVLRAMTDVRVAETSKPEELDEVLRDVGERSVVVAGGDGSLHAVMNALHRLRLLSKTRVGLLPLGTGNDFARGVGIPLDPEDAAQVIAAGATQRTDLIIDDDETVIVNNVHIGIGAEASRAADKLKPRLGRFGYALGALSAGYRPQLVRVTLQVDDRVVLRDRAVAQVALGNSSHVGGGTELIPGANPSDGRIVVIVSRTRGLRSQLAYLLRLRTGKHHLMREVDRTTGCDVVVEGEHFWAVADGEISGPHHRRHWRLAAGAVEMFLPPAP
jgi:YegS/Rv2252/BmrU family lipid kinase